MKLERDHMAKFTGKARTGGRMVHITNEEYDNYLFLQNTCESLQARLLVMESRERERETLNPENLFKEVMAARHDSGMKTTIESFVKTVMTGYDKTLQWTRISTDPRVDLQWTARNQFGKVQGYTLNEEDMDKFAGDRKQALSWIWRTGNFLMTENNEIYYFL